MSKVPFKLSGTQEEIVSGEGFPVTGLIGNWRSQIMYNVGWPEFDIDQEVKDFHAELSQRMEGFIDALKVDGKYYDHRITSKDGRTFSYFYTDRDHASTLNKLLDREVPGEYAWRWRQCWMHEAARGDVLFASEEARAKWSAVIRQSVVITTARGHNFHEFAMMALPAFVASVASYVGHDHAGFDLSELLVPDSQLIVNDQTRDRLIGGIDTNYHDSELWKRRAELWRSLGEENADAYLPKAAGDAKHSTTSDKLDEILSAYTQAWEEPFWLRLSMVPNPRPDEDKKRFFNVPCIMQLFADRAAAEAAYAAERPEPKGDEKKSTPVVVSSAGLQVPPIWASTPQGWRETVAEFKAKYGDQPPPKALKAIAAEIREEYGEDGSDGTEMFGADAATVLAWFVEV